MKNNDVLELIRKRKQEKAQKEEAAETEQPKVEEEVEVEKAVEEEPKPKAKPKRRPVTKKVVEEVEEEIKEEKLEEEKEMKKEEKVEAKEVEVTESSKVKRVDPNSLPTFKASDLNIDIAARQKRKTNKTTEPTKEELTVVEGGHTPRPTINKLFRNYLNENNVIDGVEFTEKTAVDLIDHINDFLVELGDKTTFRFGDDFLFRLDKVKGRVYSNKIAEFATYVAEHHVSRTQRKIGETENLYGIYDREERIFYETKTEKIGDSPREILLDDNGDVILTGVVINDV